MTTLHPLLPSLPPPPVPQDRHVPLQRGGARPGVTAQARAGISPSCFGGQPCYVPAQEVCAVHQARQPGRESATMRLPGIWPHLCGPSSCDIPTYPSPSHPLPPQLNPPPTPPHHARTPSSPTWSLCSRWSRSRRAARASSSPARCVARRGVHVNQDTGQSPAVECRRSWHKVAWVLFADLDRLPTHSRHRCVQPSRH
jgi:hypothetical protein